MSTSSVSTHLTRAREAPGLADVVCVDHLALVDTGLRLACNTDPCNNITSCNQLSTSSIDKVYSQHLPPDPELGRTFTHFFHHNF